MFVFRKIWRALFPCYLRLEIRLLPYYRRTILIKWMPVTHVNPQEGLATFSESMIWKPVDWLLYQTSRHWFPHSKKWTSKCWKNVQNIQGVVTESRFPSGHWKVFNRYVFVEIAPEPAALLKTNILMYVPRIWPRIHEELFYRTPSTRIFKSSFYR